MGHLNTSRKDCERNVVSLIRSACGSRSVVRPIQSGGGNGTGTKRRPSRNRRDRNRTAMPCHIPPRKRADLPKVIQRRTIWQCHERRTGDESISTKPPCASPPGPRAGFEHTENGPMARSPRLFAYAASPHLSPRAQSYRPEACSPARESLPSAIMGCRRLPSGLSRMTGNCHVRF